MSREAGERALERIGRDEHRAYVTLLAQPLVEAREGPLTGLSLAVKDNLALRNVRLTCASKVLEHHVAPFTATVVERALGAGAAVVGKANMDEFAAGSRGERSAVAPTENPAAPGHVPGGSSSGCGATLAAAHVHVALGSDTGGSVRAPGAYCGIVAFKPTNGRVSRWGLVDLAMSLDTPGPMARSVRDVARLYDVIAGPDPRDPTTIPEAPDAALPQVEAPDVGRVRIGVPRALPDGVDEPTRRAFRDAVDALEDVGARALSVELPDSTEALATYYVTCYAEFASSMHKFDGSVFGRPGAASRGLLGAEVKRRILLGTFITAREQRAAWYERAKASRARLAAAWARLFEDVDVVVTPTMPTPPPKRGANLSPLEEYAADVLTVHANLARIPAGTVPTKRTPKGPVGLQVLGPRGADVRVLAVMAAYEEARGALPGAERAR